MVMSFDSHLQAKCTVYLTLDNSHFLMQVLV